MSPSAHDLDELIVTVSDLLVASADNSDVLLDGSVEQVLRAVRHQLKLDVIFVGEFVDGRRVLRFVASGGGRAPMKMDDSEPLEVTYCKRVVDGRLPEWVADTALLAAAARPSAGGARVGTHLSTPVVLHDGSTYGTLCCFSATASPDTRQQHVLVLRECARLVARKLDLTQAPPRRQQRPDFADTEPGELAWQLQ